MHRPALGGQGPILAPGVGAVAGCLGQTGLLQPLQAAADGRLVDADGAAGHGDRAARHPGQHHQHPPIHRTDPKPFLIDPRRISGEPIGREIEQDGRRSGKPERGGGRSVATPRHRHQEHVIGKGAVITHPEYPSVLNIISGKC